ncbi:MAG TPA: ParB/RepB/Spo0J family partition protein [Patescibacteria group bacterium]|nr:ParB/RepB/Spo0J family partition protein [Patescibacteria group bacterium]
MKRKVLGRGLGALLSQDLRESVAETERIKELSIDLIDPNPNQPRGNFGEDQLRELAASIRSHGVLQPVIVRRDGDRYQLVIGERRFRASRMAGKSTVPAIVRSVTDDQSLKYALMENLQREDLNPIEEARGYRTLKERYGLSDREIGEILGRDRSTVANALRLLNLPGSVIDLIEEGKLKAGHARAILSIEGEAAQIEWARRVAEEGMTVREVEQRGGSRTGRRSRRGARRIDPAIQALEERLEMHLGTRVRITPRRKGGVLSIEYYSGDELEGILRRIGIDTNL